MKDFSHPNILGQVGVCFDAPDGYPFLILPFMVNGSLKDYLRNSRVQVADVHTFPKVRDYVHVCSTPLHYYSMFTTTESATVCACSDVSRYREWNEVPC